MSPTARARRINFQPEYSTAAAANMIPWAALQTNISTEFETGHWEPCTSVTDPGTYTYLITANPSGLTDTFYNTCHGPYEDAGPPTSTTPEASDAFCYPAGDTHGALDSAPDEMTGCEDNYDQNGDLDFDGTPYYPEWPTGPNPTAKFPGSFVQNLPTTGGAQYSKFFMQTDIALSESTCTATGAGCSVPPAGPGRLLSLLDPRHHDRPRPGELHARVRQRQPRRRGQRLRRRCAVRRRPAAEPRLSGVRGSGVH